MARNIIRANEIIYATFKVLKRRGVLVWSSAYVLMYSSANWREVYEKFRSTMWLSFLVWSTYNVLSSPSNLLIWKVAENDKRGTINHILIQSYIVELCKSTRLVHLEIQRRTENHTLCHKRPDWEKSIEEKDFNN